jgi:hypothetical protein
MSRLFMNKTTITKDMAPSELITEQISNLADWRGELLAQLRKLIPGVDPNIVEEWKWGTAVWTNGGMICNGGTFKDHVKLNFFKGAFLEDVQKLFNAGLEAKESRGIDFYEGGRINEAALKELVRSAIAFNKVRKLKKF